jgi:hypothetical protein
VVAFENGHSGPRKALWSHQDPVTLFGAEASARCWKEVEPNFDRLADSFSDGQSCTYEVVGAGVSGDPAYVAAIEGSLLARSGRTRIRSRCGSPRSSGANRVNGRSSTATATPSTPNRGKPSLIAVNKERCSRTPAPRAHRHERTFRTGRALRHQGTLQGQ